MESPMINTNSAITREIKDLQNMLREQINQKSATDECILNLQRKLSIASSHLGYCNTTKKLQEKMSKFINEGVHQEKNIVRTKAKRNEVRKHQGFTKIARAFMAFGEDPFTVNITAYVIHPTQSEEMSKKTHEIKNDMDLLL